MALLFCVSNLPAFGAGALQVRDVKFDKLGRDAWFRARVELIATDNPLPNPTNSRYLDDIFLTFYLIFGSPNSGFHFYKSEVDILSLELGDRCYIDFFIPGVIVERDRLSRNPFAHLVEMEISGNEFPFHPSHASTNLASNEAARASMKSRADSEGSRNVGVLIPSYFAPPALTVDDGGRYPAFRRIDSPR